MQKTTLTLNSQDTPFTVDMYQTFSSENTEDSEISYYNQENDTQLAYDDFDWDYDKEAILKELSHVSCKYIKENHIGDIILEVSEPYSFHSPKFYNYSTDSYMANFTVDIKKLEEYCDTDDFHKYSTYHNIYGMCSQEESEDYMLMYYLQEEQEKDDYIMYMHESESEIYSENTTMTLTPKK